MGATGMLAGALDWLAERSERTVVVARRASDALARRPRAGAVAMDLDWRRTSDFEAALAGAVDPGSVDVLLLWIHDSGKRSLQVLLDRFAPQDCLIVQVLSSASGDPSAYHDALDRRTADGRRCAYRTVKLGAMRSGTSWRWLTDDEISGGVIEAIDAGRDVVVGTAP